METNNGLFNAGIRVSLDEARKLTVIKKGCAWSYGRIDDIHVGLRANAAGEYVMDSREWLDEEDPAWDGGVEFLDYATAKQSIRPGMVLDLYCFQDEVRGKPEFGGNMVGNVEVTVSDD